MIYQNNFEKAVMQTRQTETIQQAKEEASS